MCEAEEEYDKNRPKKWVVFAIGLLIGFILGIEIPKWSSFLLNAKYSRGSLDQIMKDLLGAYNVKDALTDELLIVAYDYNSQEPRFYSKYFSLIDPAIYDVPIGNATGASSAAPTFFDPKVNQNGYGFRELQIDGGVICNNPAFYAYQLARGLRGETKLRLLSLGTGELPFTPVDADKMNVISFVKKLGEFMMNMDAYSADRALSFAIEDAENNYVRLQTTSKIGMDNIKPEAIQGLKDDGLKLWQDNQAKIEKFVAQIVDERYGKK